MSSKSRRLAAIKKLEKILFTQNTQESINHWSDFNDFVSEIDGKDGKKIKPHSFQLEARKLLKGVVWVGKIRQLGFTQLLLWEAIYRAVSTPFFCAVIFCRSGEDVSLITRRARLVINSVGVATATDSLSIIEFKNGSKIIFKNSSQLGTRSIDAVDFLLFDEAAFVRHMDIIYRASLPSTSSAVNPTIIVVSTPQHGSWFNGCVLNDNPPDIDVLNLSKQLVNGDIPGGIYSWKDNNNATKILLSHRCHPTYSQIDDYVGYRAKIEGISTEQARQEYGLGWECGETQTIFSVKSVQQCAVLDSVTREKESLTEYIGGLDCAAQGQDYTVLTIWKKQLNEDNQPLFTLVDFYSKKQETIEYNLNSIINLIKKYRAKVAVETNSIGQVYYERLKEDFSNIIPVKTTSQSKPAMIFKLQLALEETCLLFPQECKLTDELLSFIRVGDKFEASNGKHDDWVMSVAIMLYGMKM